jgi:hypothetical protein
MSSFIDTPFRKFWLHIFDTKTKYDKQIYKYTVSTEANFSKGCLMISISRYSIYAIVNIENEACYCVSYTSIKIF